MEADISSLSKNSLKFAEKMGAKIITDRTIYVNTPSPAKKNTEMNEMNIESTKDTRKRKNIYNNFTNNNAHLSIIPGNTSKRIKVYGGKLSKTRTRKIKHNKKSTYGKVNNRRKTRKA